MTPLFAIVVLGSSLLITSVRITRGLVGTWLSETIGDGGGNGSRKLLGFVHIP